MTAPNARQPDEKWRIGTSWGIHVYQGEKGSPGERYVATFPDSADAQRAVDAVNGGLTDPADAAVAELNQIVAALSGDQPFPRTIVGDAVHNLRGRAEVAERLLAEARAEGEAVKAAAVADLRARVEAVAQQIVNTVDPMQTGVEVRQQCVARLRAAVTDTTGGPA